MPVPRPPHTSALGLPGDTTADESNFASGGHEKPLPGTARALLWKVENSKKMQIPPSFWRTTGVPLWCVLLSCFAAVVDWSVRTALQLL